MSATTFPCRSVIDCPCDDSPFENLSAEGVDSRAVPGFYYGCAGADGIPAVCEAATTELAELCAARECDNYTLFYSQETTCACSTDSSITYTLPSGSFIALSQEDADALAEAFACNVAELICDGSPVPELFRSTPQTCEASCDGGTVSYSTIAGMFLGFTQAEADALALAFACDVAALLCVEGPDNPDPVPRSSAFNDRQSCTIDCPEGGQFTYFVDAGVFRANNAAQANAMAYSYACRQSVLVRFCLGGEIDDRVCISEATEFVIEIGGNVPDSQTWAITSGSVPTGMTFTNGMLFGTPSAAGSYTFTVRLTDGDGNYATRQYTVIVFAITNTSPLEEPVIGTPYLVNFATSSGDPELQQWTVIAGTLPDGLTLEENGILHGTPTETGEFPITVRVLDTTPGFEPLSCMKDFTFPGCPVPEDYSYNCPLNVVPKSYALADDYFVAFHDGWNRVLVPNNGNVEVVNFTPGVPVLESTIVTGFSAGRALAAIYDPINEITVISGISDILASQPSISFVNDSGTVLSTLTLAGFQAGLKNNHYLTRMTAGTGYVILFLNSFSLTNDSRLLLIDTTTRAVVTSRNFPTTGTDPSYDGLQCCYSCANNEIVLIYQDQGGSGNYFMQRLSAEDLTDVALIDLGADFVQNAEYDPATNRIIVQVDDGVSWKLKYLNPTTGAVEASINTGYASGGSISYFGAYAFKLLGFVFPLYDDGVVKYFDSLTATAKCSVSFAGMINPTAIACREDNGSAYVLDQGSANVWELTTT